MLTDLRSLQLEFNDLWPTGAAWPTSEAQKQEQEQRSAAIGRALAELAGLTRLVLKGPCLGASTLRKCLSRLQRLQELAVWGVPPSALEAAPSTLSLLELLCCDVDVSRATAPWLSRLTGLTRLVIDDFNAAFEPALLEPLAWAARAGAGSEWPGVTWPAGAAGASRLQGPAGGCWPGGPAAALDADKRHAGPA